MGGEDSGCGGPAQRPHHEGTPGAHRRVDATESAQRPVARYALHRPEAGVV